VVQNLVLDTIEPFITRIRNLEDAVHTLAVRAEEPVEAPAVAQVADTAIKVAERATDIADVLQDRLDAVIALHALDATPAQWIYQGGKQEAAPDGLWEIECRACGYKVTWMQGDPEPKRCKTVQMARGTA
jgi:DNA-directed RNA polymerase subunit RPC12/RpoP